MQKEISTKIEKILWGKSIVEVDNSEGHTLPFILRSLTIRETNYANYIYQKEHDDAIALGMLTREEMKAMHIETGVWTEYDDVYLKGLQKKLDLLGNKLQEYQFITSRKKKIVAEIQKVKRELADKRNDQSNLFSHTVESRAEEVSRRFIVMMAAETMQEKPYWTSEDEFMAFEDHYLLFNLTIAYYNNNIYPESELREIARCGQWRFRWNAAKNGTDMFGRPLSEYSEMQNLLVYWSQHYDYIYEHPERPGQEVIENDEACDAWIKQVSKEAKSKATTKDSKNFMGTKKATTNQDHQEHFIMVQPGDKEAVTDIQEMNSDETRKTLRKEHDKIHSSNRRMTEWELRKGKNPKG